MPRIVLRTITVISVICLCYLIPNKIAANHSEYGPELDPIISDESENISLTCPPPITVDCDDNGIYMTYLEFTMAGGSVNLPSGCVVDSFTFVADVQISQSGCSFVYFREYFIAESCGNTFTCNQIIMLTDDDNPVILNPPNDTSFQVSMAPCTVSFAVPELETSDGCSAVTVTNDAPADFGVGTTIVTYTAIDACGNSAQESFMVEVESNGMLTVECPPAIMDSTVCDISGVAAYADFMAFAAAGGSVSGECTTMGTVFTIDNVSEITIGGSCPKTVNRTYTISDEFGNVDSCIQLITLVDTMRPTFMVPADMMGVDCAQVLDTMITGTPSNVMDNCDPDPVVTFTDIDTVMGSCMGEYSFTRVWTVTDACGNKAEDTQEISVVDNTAPTAICNADVTIYLDSFGVAPIIPEDVDAGSFDECSSVTLDSNIPQIGCNEIGVTTMVNLIVSDACNNTALCSANITILDTISVTLTSPENDTISCIADLAAPFNNLNNYTGSVEDNCTIGSMLNLISADTVGLCPTIVTRIYEYMDSFGNSDTASHKILVIDDEAPMIASCPPDISITESDICDTLLIFGLPMASDNCGELTITNNYTNDTSSMAIFSGGVTEIIFTVSDACGNSSMCTTTVTLDANPKIICPPLGVIDSKMDLPDYPNFQAFLDAGGMVNVNCDIDTMTFMYSNSFVINSDSCSATVTENIAFNDNSGSSITAEKMSMAMDTLNPEISVCFNQFVALNQQTCEIDTNFILPTATDNFGVDTTYFTLGEFVNDTADVVFYAQDLCGNIDSCEFELIIYDPSSPDLDIDDITIMCDSTGAAPAYTTLDEFLTGPGANIVECRIDTSSFALDTTYTNIPGNIVRVYSIDDLTGQTGTVMQTIVIMDTTNPEITMCTEDITTASEMDTCGASIMVPLPIYMDNCDSITITNDYNGTADASDFYVVGSTKVIWTIVDGSGFMDTCSFMVTINDMTFPAVVNPDTIEIMCEDMIGGVDTLMTVQDIMNAGGGASDNCGIEFINLVSQNDIGNDSIQREYAIIDSSGNSTPLFQYIVLNDTIPPTFEAPADKTVACDDDLMDVSITGTVDTSMLSDNCMVLDTLIYEDSMVPGSCPIISEITRIWILTDGSGNETRDTQLISTIDTISPVFDSMPASLSNIDCDEDYPIMEVLTATDDCTGSSVSMDTLPIMIDHCNGYAVTYRWIAEDGCQNRDTITASFLVNPDDTPPSLVSLNNATVESAGDLCGIRVDSVPGPKFEEDCSIFDLTRNYSDTIYHIGMNNIEWIATNQCGLDSTVTQVVIVEDNILPVVLCKDATAGITADPQNYVYTSSFIDTASDNCGVDSMFVRRLTAACDDPDNVIFGDSIHICCEDVGNLIDVEIRVVDESGNENFCDATLLVHDKRAPLIEYYLPDIVVSCSYVFDTLDLDVFGSYTSDPNGRESIIIEDTLYASQDSIAGLDGLVSDECMVTITDTTIVKLDQCSKGYIKRIFTFTDPTGNSTNDEQIITIQDVSPFNENGTDITWPEDYTWNQCGVPAPDTSVSGSPAFANLDKCAQVSASFKDQLFNIPTSVCPKVRRKWKVIDWCQYDESVTPNPGLWTYNQFIFVENLIAPTIISGCGDTTICTSNNECSTIVSLGIEAEDDCIMDTQFLTYAYSINANSDANPNNDIKGMTSSFSLELETGIHEVTWVVTDRCGNSNSCTYTLTVNECKAPTAVCLVGLGITLDQNGEAELWASDVNQSSTDNCTDVGDLVFSFSQDVTEFGKVFGCDDVATPQYIELWVTDLEGNQAFCSTFVDVQDNNGYCNNIIDDNVPGILQGKIATETDESIPEAMVSIFGAEMDEEFMTSEDGEFVFENINVENDYQIKVERDKDDIDGVSTLDLVQIQRHILGLQDLNSPYKLIAADINSDEKVTASDLLALRKLILGIDESFPDNQSWRFVSTNTEMSDMGYPWPFNEDLVIGNSPLDQLQPDFIGVKIGDVNNSVDNYISSFANENRNNKIYGITTKDQSVQRDEEVLVDFISKSNIELEGLQMTIAWDKESMNFIDLIPIGVQFEDTYINKTRVNEGLLTIAWSSIESKLISAGTPIFQLIFEGNYAFNLSENLSITSEITQALAYDENDIEHNVELLFSEGQREGLMLFQNKPNPFASETVVEFTLPEDMEVTFKVFNGAGSLIFKQTQPYNEGLNAIVLNDQLGDHTGLLFLKMETAEFSEVKRMIRIE